MSNNSILFLIFNRPDSTFQVFEQIRQAKPAKLFIAADGPRADRVGEAELCAQARSVLDKVDWDCEVHTLFQDENLGCKYGPSTAIDWFFQNVEEGIILEDDCVPDPSFFPYCQELLEKYRNNPRILSVCGYNFGYSSSKTDPSYFFSRYFFASGWASWRRNIKLIDYEIKEWDKIDKVRFLHNRTRASLVDFDWKWIKDWRRTFNDLVNLKVDAWDYCWLYAGFKYKMLSIFPSENLVQNIGFNEDATHTHDDKHIMGKIKSNPISLPLAHPKKINRNIEFEENYIKKVWQSYHRKGLIYQLKTFTREELLPKIGIH